MSDYYDHGSYPATSASGTSSPMRAEFDLVTTGISNKLPTITGNGSKIIAVNSGATVLEAITTTGTGSGVRATAPTFTTSINAADVSFTAFAGATTLLTIGGTGASASMFAPSTLDSTSSITGAIRTSGGISAAKALWVGGLANIAGAVTMQGALVGDAVTDSTSISSGAFQTDGGLGVTKALWVGGLANIAGAVTLQSTLAVTGAVTLSGAIKGFNTQTETGATASLSASSFAVICNRAGTVTLTLPDATTNAGRMLTIKTIQAQAVESASANVVPNNDNAAGTAILPATDGANCLLISDGSSWVTMLYSV